MRKFLANENIPLATILKLRKEGIDISSISFDSPSITDREVMQISIDENRTIITFDRDYGELIYKYGFRPPAGVIYLRMQNFQPEEPAELILKLLNNPTLEFTGLFTVADEKSIRQRKIRLKFFVATQFGGSAISEIVLMPEKHQLV
jgi:predicted nuclease of predicted toxin-antitoxin system